MAPDEDITYLIRRWQSGDEHAEKALFDMLYRRLHQIALGCLRSEKACLTLGPTALVHEAYLRFNKTENLQIAGRNHFLALASRAMRRIIVDHARARRSEKRGGRDLHVQLCDNLVRTDRDADLVIAIDRALDDLIRHAPRQAQIVELRYFGGYSIEETAEVLGISTRTARRDWDVARTRLKGAIDGAA